MSGLSNEVTDAVRTAIAHDISPIELVEMVQEAWDMELQDKRRYDMESFNSLLKQMRP